MRAYLALPSAVLLVLGPAALPAAAAAAADDDGSQVAFALQDQRITESSGLAASRQHPGVYWTHNDSDDGPYVYAVDSRGRTVATVTLRGVDPRDVEAISVGPDGQVYVGDTGDNFGGRWAEVWIYRFKEPAKLRDMAVDVVRYRVRYADGPRDAEALMVHPVTGRVYIASKHEDGGRLYAGPERLSESGINTFHRIAEVPWVTDGAFSPDGTRLILRGYFWSNEYRWRDGSPEKLGRVDMPLQQQGESVTFSADGRSVLYGSEGSGSDVWRIPLDGDLLPDSAAKQDRAAKGSGPKGGADAPDRTRDITVGAVVLGALLVAVVAALRRLRSRLTR